MSTLDIEPYFASEAQETFTVGSRVYAIDAVPGVLSQGGTEGTYIGRVGREAIVDWDTPSGEPFRAGAPYATIRNLYR